MSLDSNISDLATAIGQEIKDVRADMALISGGESGVQNVFIQDIEPSIATGNKALWLDTTNGDITFNLVIGD